MGTVKAIVATMNSAWSSMYMTCRLRSPSSPLSLHQMLFAFCAFFESSLYDVMTSGSFNNLCRRSTLTMRKYITCHSV
uniref:Uncharacterized protein n=1 Tax=Arundo donax TaxID=35708 RepID=A0A0A9F8V8_ARUDO